MEGMSQRTNYAIKMYTFKSYLFIDGKKFPHTKYDKLGYHPNTIFMTLIIEFNLVIKLNTEMVKILSKLSFTVFYKKH
jgi:hypothetical protein